MFSIIFEFKCQGLILADFYFLISAFALSKVKQLLNKQDGRDWSFYLLYCSPTSHLHHWALSKKRFKNKLKFFLSSLQLSPSPVILQKPDNLMSIPYGIKSHGVIYIQVKVAIIMAFQDLVSYSLNDSLRYVVDGQLYFEIFSVEMLAVVFVLFLTAPGLQSYLLSSSPGLSLFYPGPGHLSTTRVICPVCRWALSRTARPPHGFSPAVTTIISVAGTVGSARSRSFAPAVAAPALWAAPGTAPSVAETSANQQESQHYFSPNI